MSRFFQGQNLNFDNNYFYIPPWELAAQAMAYNDKGINTSIEQANLIGDINVEHIPDEKEKELLERELTPYREASKNFSTNIQLGIQNSPQSWKKYMPGLKSLGQDLNKNLTTGNLAKIRQSTLNFAAWKEENKDIKEQDPYLYNMALNHYMSNWANDETNPDRSLGKTWTGDKVINYDMNSQEFMKDLKNLKADYWDSVQGAWIVGTEKMDEKQIEQYIVGHLMSSPKAVAYLKQMETFKAPGFYDSTTGRAIPLRVARGIGGEILDQSQLSEEQEKWEKLSPELRSLTPYPTLQLNPQHAWTPNIMAKEVGYGYTKRTLKTNQVWENAQRRAERAEDRKLRERQIELRAKAQAEGAESPAAKKNGEAQGAQLSSIQKAIANSGVPNQENHPGTNIESQVYTAKYEDLLWRIKNSSGDNKRTAEDSMRALLTRYVNKEVFPDATVEYTGRGYRQKDGKVAPIAAAQALYKAAITGENGKEAVEAEFAKRGFIKYDNEYKRYVVTEKGRKNGLRHLSDAEVASLNSTAEGPVDNPFSKLFKRKKDFVRAEDFSLPGLNVGVKTLNNKEINTFQKFVDDPKNYTNRNSFTSFNFSEKGMREADNLIETLPSQFTFTTSSGEKLNYADIKEANTTGISLSIPVSGTDPFAKGLNAEFVLKNGEKVAGVVTEGAERYLSRNKTLSDKSFYVDPESVNRMQEDEGYFTMVTVAQQAALEDGEGRIMTVNIADEDGEEDLAKFYVKKLGNGDNDFVFYPVVNGIPDLEIPVRDGKAFYKNLKNTKF